ncbi:MAG: hypothetical protein Kow0069_05640 [Promethearchaeota archaeon]
MAKSRLVLDASRLTPAVGKLVRDLRAAQARLTGEYLQASGGDVDFKALWSRVAEVNLAIFEGRSTFERSWRALDHREMAFLARLHRWVGDQLVERGLVGGEPVKDVSLTREEIRPPRVTGFRSEVGPLAVEWQVPSGTGEPEAGGRAVAFFHGGGMITGSIEDHRPLSAWLASEAGLPVASVDYRLAPEHPFPAAVDDCVAALEALAGDERAAGGFVVAGDSAGGYLALASTLQLMERGSRLPDGVVCFSPLASYADLEVAFREKAAGDPILSDAGAFWWVPAYLGVDGPADVDDPRVSPLRGDLRGFPPLLVQATPPEVLFEQGAELVRRGKQAGVDAELQTWPDVVHVWQLFGRGVLPEAAQAVREAARFVRKSLGLPPARSGA